MRRGGTRRLRLIPLAAVVAVMSMSCCRDWPQADAFARGLRCGMSVEEVRARVRSFGANALIADDRVPVLYGTHVVARGSSRVYLDFGAEGLRWTRVGSQSGLWAGMRIGVKHDLCSGKEFVSLVINGSPGWEGATVTVNGTIVGTLSPAPSALLETDVPVGRSQLVITTPQSTFRKDLSFDRNSNAVVQIDVPR